MTEIKDRYDAVIIGAGIAGASLAADLASHMSVLLLEMEDQPGYHATGRAVAFWSESYGGPDIRPLTRASGPFLSNPPKNFSDHGFLSPRGGIHIGQAQDNDRRNALISQFGNDDLFTPIDEAALRHRVPALKPQWCIGLEEAGLRDIDAAGLHGAYLSHYRREGGAILCGNAFRYARKAAGGGTGQPWEITLNDDTTICAPTLINAAGAWADEVATRSGVKPLGITPLLRTVAQLRISPPVDDDMPLILDLSERFYFKPVGQGRIWLTPHDEIPSAPTDAAPDDLNVAIAIDRLQSVMDWRIEAVERKWAGLRSFAPDRKPIYGHDPNTPGFFWFAGQGGFGIQTAPAAAKLASSLLTGDSPDPMLRDIDATAYLPDRFLQ